MMLPEPNEAHVWTYALEASQKWVDRCTGWLADEEVQRATCFRFEDLRRSFTLSRGLLRLLISRYVGCEPEDIRFAYGPRGKPRITAPETRLQFNLSHGGRYGIYAFAVDCELGVDIEEVRPLADIEGVVRRFFSPAEYADWLSVEEARREVAFFECWTRKEAYIKALGDGLSMALDSFRVSLLPDSPAVLLEAAAERDPAGVWRLKALTHVPGYAAALAVAEQVEEFRIMPVLRAGE